MVEELDKSAQVEGEVPPTGTDGKNINEKKPSPSYDFLPNVLDDFDSYAYHFRLFMMDEESIKTRNIGPASKDRRVVIAESGATTIGIYDVSITSFPGPSKAAGVGSSTHFQFTLQQPLGANLLDLIFAGANRLGIKNFTRVPVFLELSFRGREPERTLGNVASNVIDQANSGDPFDVRQSLLGEDKLKDIVWVWPIRLSDMSMDVNSGGSTYVITAQLWDHEAYTNQASDLEKKTTIPAQTVKEFFVGLEKELTRKEEDKTEKSKTQEVKDTYKFYIDKGIAQSKIVPDLASDVANRSGEFNIENPDKMEYSFDPGTSLEKVVETILTTTEYFQTKSKGTKQKDKIAEENASDNAIVQTIYRLYTDTQLGEFDPVRRDYSRHYRYLIVPYEMTTIQTQSNTNAKVSDQRRFDLIKNKGRVRKSYNYLYTGLNDQVLDFDITFNFNWHAAVPFQAGVTTSSVRAEPQAAEAKVDDKGNELKDKEAKGGNDPSGPFGLNISGPIGEFVNDLDDFIQNDATIGGIIEGVSTGDFDQLTGLTSQFLASEVSKGIRLAGGRFAPNLVQSGLEERDAFVEDETPESISALKSAVTYIESTQGKDHRISGGNAESPGKTLLTTMFEQAQSAIDADLMDITLRIKGDPYWLEPCPMFRNSEFKTTFDVELEKYNVKVNHQDPDGAVETVSPENTSNIDSINATSNQEYILFRNFTPKEANPITGLVEGFDGNNVLNGIYAVRLIEHNFAAGQYVASIDAQRDPNIAIENVDIGLGVADTRSILEQFNIEDIIDAPTIFDDIIPRQTGEDPTAVPGGVPNNTGIDDDYGITGLPPDRGFA